MLKGIAGLSFLVLLTAAPMQAGVIQPPLDKVIAEADDSEFIDAIIVMADMVDLDALKQELYARHADRREWHESVVTALQNKAAASQTEIIAQLEELVDQGLVGKFQGLWIGNVVLITATKEAFDILVQRDDVLQINLDYEIVNIEPVSKGDDEEPVTAGVEAGLEAIRADEVWAMGITGAGRLVSHLDTGVDGNHPALNARWRGYDSRYADNPEWAWFDPVTSTNFPFDAGSHGTHTMGTICGLGQGTGDTIGVAFGAEWISAGVIDRVSIPQTISDAILAFQWIADPDENPATVWDVPDVCSNSWGISEIYHGYDYCDPMFWSVLNGCEAAGVFVVFAAGNEGPGSRTIRNPATRATTDIQSFAVGALDGNDPGLPIASFSSRGPSECTPGGENAIKPEVAAPGVSVRSSVPGGGYQGGWNGTSMACPHVAGIVALMRQANPNLTTDQIGAILLETATDLGVGGEDNAYGMGIVDAYEAVLMASGGLGYVEGHVYESDNNSPVQATVEILETGNSTIANSSGYYILTVPAGNDYTLRASYHDYVTDEAPINVDPDQTIIQDFYLGPPNIGNDPSSYSVSALPGEIVEQDLTIYNDGVGGLQFTLSSETFDRRLLRPGGNEPDVSEARVPTGYKTYDYSKNPGYSEPYYPPVITGQGGPDAFGHEWIDSDESGGPPVDWIDISGVGTPVSLGDDDYAGPIGIGFTFPYYDNNYSSLYIGSNGVLTFGGGDTEWVNTGIPNSSPPNNFIAMFWDDLRPPSGGNIYYYSDTDNNRFIVSFVNVPFYYWGSGTGSTTFEAILYPDGDIYLNYGTMSPGSHTLSSATIGIENAGASDGLQIVYDASYMHSNLSIYISAGKWLDVTPSSGSVPGSGGSLVATVTFDASDLTEGTYTGRVNLDSDDPDTPNIDISATFIVGEGVGGTIYGTVTDLDTGNPISGVQVYADDGGGNNGSDITAGDGTYSIFLPPSTYTVTFTHDDYYETEEIGVVVTDGGNTQVDVQMEPLPGQDVPTLSEWGMIILTLLLVGAATVGFVRRKKEALTEKSG